MFADLRICCGDGAKQGRREALAAALQLGYTAVAVPHVVSGVMQQSDFCKLAAIEPQVLLAAVPGVCESTKFHRRLLGVSNKVPFRQYSRITVVVADQLQAAAVNAFNPVIQSYDIVAVQPMTQQAFAQACTTMEVDVIILNLTNLPFRIRSLSSLIDAAIKRGIFFEISYNSALKGGESRRDLIMNAEVLVSVTRGRNIIVTSGARSAWDIRGPNDAANLSTLFGLTMEQAKVAISKNCDLVILHAYTRKNTHRAAIAIETVEEKPLFEVPSVWDPLSTTNDCVLPGNDESDEHDEHDENNDDDEDDENEENEEPTVVTPTFTRRTPTFTMRTRQQSQKEKSGNSPNNVAEANGSVKKKRKRKKSKSQKEKSKSQKEKSKSQKEKSGSANEEPNDAETNGSVPEATKRKRKKLRRIVHAVEQVEESVSERVVRRRRLVTLASLGKLSFSCGTPSPSGVETNEPAELLGSKVNRGDQQTDYNPVPEGSVEVLVRGKLFCP